MKKLVVVCSKNKAKNLAVKSVLEQYLEEFETVSLETNSQVSETPIGDVEGIEGCFNRIEDALSQNNIGDLYIAMEGILNQNKYGTFICGWTVVYDRDNNEYYYGCSAKVKVPDEIMKKFDKSVRLSDIVSDFFGSKESEIRNYGTNGILTHGSYTRTDEFIDSLECAISTKFEKQYKN